MNRYPAWKYILIGVTLAFGLLYMVPNFFPEVPAVQVSSSKASVKIDPIYGAGKAGIAGASDTSLSKPLSAFAKASVASPEDASWVGKLPANQKCG